jgi:pyridoxine kinase
MAILSIQSHVVYGYVGNRAATFPLQLLGHEVHAINTVQFSNHTGYGHWRGEIFSAQHIADLVMGLAELGAIQGCDAVLSGYLGKQAIGQEVLKAVALCQQHNPQLIYACDPVMGDVGRGIFVQQDIPAFLLQHAIPQAQILTPNHFEMELLCQRPITSISAAIQACELLRTRPEQIIVVTSFKQEAGSAQRLDIFMSCAEGNFLISTPYLAFAQPPNGTGDLFSALFLGYYLKQRDAVKSLELATAAVYGVLQYSFVHGQREMQLVKAQEQIRQASVTFRCQYL